jgi:general secretion pathway protein C
MRLVLDPRAWRLLRRLPRYSVYSLVEIALLLVLALQLARLAWTVVTPVGPLGDWRLPAIAPDSASRLAAIDPFFRLQATGGTDVVTSLQLTLYGVRVDEAMGRGSAIISGPDGVQNSYAVGDTILPGVVLSEVGYDSVTIQRGGASEKIFIDQSSSVEPVETAAAPAVDTVLDGGQAAPGSRALTAAELQSGIDFLPRSDRGRVTGLVVRPRGDGQAFRIAGFRDGDILVTVGGNPVTSLADIQRAAAGVASGGTVSVGVERGSDVVPIAISVTGQ